MYVRELPSSKIPKVKNTTWGNITQLLRHYP